MLNSQRQKPSSCSGKRRTLSEDGELIKFFEWLAWQTIQRPEFAVVHHVENERRTSWSQGKTRKQKGVKAGIPDIVAPIPRGRFPGLYIEMKSEHGKLSDKQKTMCELLHSLGHCVRLARSADEAIEIFKKYIKGEI